MAQGCAKCFPEVGPFEVRDGVRPAPAHAGRGAAHTRSRESGQSKPTLGKLRGLACQPDALGKRLRDGISGSSPPGVARPEIL